MFDVTYKLLLIFGLFLPILAIYNVNSGEWANGFQDSFMLSMRDQRL